MPFGESGINLQLYPSLLFPFICVTIIITLCGYLINDYFDHQSDIANKKKNKLQNPNAYLIAYSVLFTFGFGLAFYIAFEIEKIHLSLIYLVASSLLFLYSSHFKKQILIGNVIVSLFTSFVLLIILYAEKDAFLTLKMTNYQTYTTTFKLIIFYAVFAFAISMIREIIKDIEDYDGDRMANYNTMPIAFGIKFSKAIAMLYIIVLILILLYWIFTLESQTNVLHYYFIGLALILPLFIISFKLQRAKYKAQYHQLSQWCKIHMLNGLLYLILQTYL